MPQTDLFAPFTYRGLTFRNRVAMSPLTRARASHDSVPGPLQAEYYRQRSSAGLIVSEAIAVSPEGRGGVNTPGIYTPEQVEGWKLTTSAVHAAGGLIFAQLFHAGRVSHSVFSPDGRPPVSPSAIAAEGQVFTDAGLVPYEAPRALELDEIAQVIAQYRTAADNAMAAGFDGVELHGAHGYLPDSFLRDVVNDRTDAYGGTIARRARFMVELMEQLVESAGVDRVIVRLSPNTSIGGKNDSDAAAAFAYVIDRMNDLDVAWLDLVEGQNLVTRNPDGAIDSDALAARFKGKVMRNHLYDRDMAVYALVSGKADMIAFGRPFIGNPDLVARLRAGAPLADAPRQTWYSGGAKGYTDYPAMADA